MATLLLVPLFGAIGGALIPGTILGVGIGAAVGQVVGGLLGAYIDNWLFGSSGQKQISEGPRLEDLKVTSSTEGQPIPRLYGRARMGGVIIWTTDFKEVRTESTQSAGGGKGGGGGSGQKVTTITYQYYCSFAIAICEGEITSIGRVWADGKEINLDDYTYTVYKGTETQNPNAHIESIQGVGKVPGYRGLAYIVFNNMLLEKFGNRVPQFNFEVFKSVDNFEKQIKGLSILPGSGEFVYSPTKYTQQFGTGVVGETLTRSLNVNTRRGGTDWTVSMRDMEDVFENLAHAALIVTWYGDDLRCGNCTIRPKVDRSVKNTLPTNWLVSSTNRASAQVVSQVDGRPAFGSTPDDKSVYDAIIDLKARGLGVTFYPFIMMDIPAGNSLPNPYTNGGSGVGQSVYPWRGRITCHPAPGMTGTVDKTATATTQINSFVGACLPSHFTIVGSAVNYSGPNEWTYRRMILHYAKLCAAAGGVDTFIIGTELRGLTWTRSAQFAHPFVTALKTLAADVSSILPSAKVVYGADWSEFTPYQTPDGEVDFHLDPLWSDANIDAIGIDNYWPLSDWRPGSSHLDRLAGVRTIYDLDYLKGNLAGGEGYDWYYADEAGRDNQTRLTISDSLGKPWVFRYKDIKNWWLNNHRNRAGGIEVGSNTAWTPQSKPFWFTEVGCPAINFGANQPNVFYDPKSSESFIPYYSSGARDDFIQRQHIRAFTEYYDPTNVDFVEANNPVSGVYGGRMVDPDRIYVYTWDARPFPAFPYNLDVWSDGTNWLYGHWLTGRVSGGALSAILRNIFEDYQFFSYDVSGLNGYMDGFIIDRVMSIRDAIQPLEVAFFYDTFESEGLVKMRHRGALGSQITVTPEDLVEDGEGNLFEVTRGQETELPLAAKVVYSDANRDYQQAAVEAKRLTVLSERVSTANLPIVMRQSTAQPIADILLHENWVSRERGKFTLPPSKLFIEPTDVLTLNANGHLYKFRTLSIADRGSRALEVMQIDSSIYDYAVAPDRESGAIDPVDYGNAVAYFMNLPMLSDYAVPQAGYVAAYLEPFPGGVAFLRSPDLSNFLTNSIVYNNCVVGNTLTAYNAGPEGLFDNANTIDVLLFVGELTSVTDIQVLAGANACAIRNADGEWEVLQFQNATLIGSNTYRLSKLLRGQLGTEKHMRSPVAIGAPFVLLNASIQQVSMEVSDINTTYNWKVGPVNRPIDDDSYFDKSWAFNGMGLKCYSPTDFVLKKNYSNNDLVVSWIRRNRIGGDNWDTSEIPMSEEYERYQVEIYSGATLKRTVTVNSATTLTYTSAQQVADFGSNQSTLDVQICQVNPYGLGHKRRRTLSIGGAV